MALGSEVIHVFWSGRPFMKWNLNFRFSYIPRCLWEFVCPENCLSYHNWDSMIPKGRAVHFVLAAWSICTRHAKGMNFQTALWSRTFVEQLYINIRLGITSNYMHHTSSKIMFHAKDPLILREWSLSVMWLRRYWTRAVRFSYTYGIRSDQWSTTCTLCGKRACYALRKMKSCLK